MSIQTSRRAFLAGSATAAAALVIGTHIPIKALAKTGASLDGAALAPNAFVRVSADNVVTVIIKHIEFGQGPATGLATMVAEEMDADWGQMRAELAPANDELYPNGLLGQQGTGGSTATPSSWDPMRKAGAAARVMLVNAAAERFGATVDELTVSKGVITAPDGQSATFGELAEAASQQPVMEEPPLKAREDYTLIGTDLTKLDSVAKTNGTQTFTLDVMRDDMLVSTILHPPQFGATLDTLDDAAARAVKGVVDVKSTPEGVVVYGENTFAALKGRAALKATWNADKAETRSSEEMIADYRAAAQTTGAIATSTGDVEAALAGGDIVDAEYTFPFLAHAPMETLDAVIEKRGDEAEVWMGAQIPGGDKRAIASALGLSPGNVKLNVMFAGGSFGRRAQPAADFATEAGNAFAALGRDGALKHMWTRENDIRGGRYRPLAVHRMRGKLAADGSIAAWDQQIAIQSFVKDSPFSFMVKDGIDPTAVEGASDLPYAIPNHRVGLHLMENGVPTLWWRSVGHTHTAYTTETFYDELLASAGIDPVEGRLANLGDNARHKGVLERVALMANWGGPVPEGRARGVSLHKSFNSYVANIIEVSDENGGPKVHHVWAAVDCGIAVNPNIITAQMEGGIGYGLSAALFNALTLGPGGKVAQSNFDTYRSLRINEMPKVEISIIDSDEPPTGIGEPGLPNVAPAIANAWRTLTGQKIRRLPMLNPVA